MTDTWRPESPSGEIALLDFLARAGATLGASLDYEKTLGMVTELAVPLVADWCGVFLRRADGVPVTVAMHHVNRAKGALLRSFQDALVDRGERLQLFERPMRTQMPEILSGLDDAAYRRIAIDPAHLEALRTVAPTSWMVLPLVVEGTSIGALSLGASENGRTLGPTERALAEELARRSATAVHNARLFAIAQEERRAAEAADRAKDEFLAMVSHELRAPLNAILGFTSLLRAGGLPKDQEARALEIVERNAKNQVALIEDLLDVSRIISGKLRLRLTPVDLPAVVESAIETLRPSAEGKGVALESSIDRAAAVPAGDSGRLLQVVSNLVGNALKFTPRGGHIRVVLERASDGIALSVSDDGQGIDPAFLPHVFDRFRQADGGVTRPHGGLGLGLAIVRHLVDLHGGTVSAASAGIGQGARFLVRIPTTRRRTGDLLVTGIAAELAAHRESLLDLHVLVVDDEEDARDLVRSMLEREGAKVRVAASHDQALAKLSESVPDVLVSDLAMPGKSGYELIETVRARREDDGGRLPAIALTALARMEDRERALRAGFDAHVAKPVEMGELVGVVATLAGRRSLPAPR